MKFFIDTADIEAIAEVKAMGMCDGVTTNPSLMAKEGRTDTDAVLRFAVEDSGQGIARQEDPTLTSFVATITTFFPGATPDRVEALVTKPLEDELREIRKLQSVALVERAETPPGRRPGENLAEDENQ